MQRNHPLIGGRTHHAASPLTRLLSSIAAVALLVVGFMFSIVAAVFMLGILLIAALYLWWKTRSVRKLMRDLQEQAASHKNHGNFRSQSTHAPHDHGPRPQSPGSHSPTSGSGLTIEGESARIND